MPTKRANVKNEKQYEALKDKGMSKERAAKIANSPGRVQEGRQELGIVAVAQVERARVPAGTTRRRSRPAGRAARRRRERRRAERHPGLGARRGRATSRRPRP